MGSVAERSAGRATRLASMNGGSQATVIAAGDLIALEPAWRRRQSAAWSGDPAATWEWLAAGAHHLPATHPLLLLGTPDVPIALLRLVGRGRFRIAVPLGHGAGLDRMALCPATDPASARVATHSARSIATVWLPFMAGGTIATGGQEVRRGHGEFLSIGCRDWGEYYGSRSRSLRKTIRLANNRRSRADEKIRLWTLPPGETSARLHALAAVEAGGRRKTGYLLSHPRAGPFTARWVRHLDEAGHIRTRVAVADGRICAFLVGVVAARRYLAYSMAMLDAYSPYALGHLLFHDAIRDALTCGESVDLGSGSTAFKLRWATSASPLEDVLVGRPTPRQIARVGFGLHAVAREIRLRSSANAIV